MVKISLTSDEFGDAKAEEIVENGKKDSKTNCHAHYQQAVVDSLFFGRPGDFFNFPVRANKVVFYRLNHKIMVFKTACWLLLHLKW